MNKEETLFCRLGAPLEATVMEESSIALQLPRPPSKKWVTFDDDNLMDDAMEGGKLGGSPVDMGIKTRVQQDHNIPGRHTWAKKVILLNIR